MTDNVGVTFRFDGGIADNHELNFYEAGRFQYGASRLIYTAEIFRRTGKVPQKIVWQKRKSIDLRIRAAEPRCFFQAVLIYGAPIIADTAVQTSIQTIIAYGLNILFPAQKEQEIVRKIAEEHSKQFAEREETARVAEREQTERTRMLVDAVRETAAVNSQMLELIREIKEERVVTPESQKLTQKDLNQIEALLGARLQRERIMASYQDGLSRIDADDERKFSRQLRKTLPDIAMPLGNSAETLSLGVAANDDDERNVGYFDDQTVRSILETEEDDDPTSLRGEIRMYDKQQGIGKFVSDAFEDDLSFKVPGGEKTRNQRKIIENMNNEEVFASFYIVRDINGSPVRLIFDKIIDE